MADNIARGEGGDSEKQTEELEMTRGEGVIGHTRMHVMSMLFAAGFVFWLGCCLQLRYGSYKAGFSSELASFRPSCSKY